MRPHVRDSNTIRIRARAKDRYIEAVDVDEKEIH